MLNISDKNLRRLKQIITETLSRYTYNSPLGHFHLADIDVSLLGDDPLPEFLVVGLEVEEVFARQLLPDHVAQPAPAPRPGVAAPGDGVVT